jgi:hypothetical protein
MEPSAKQVEILRAAAAFATVARYHGTLPRRQALHYAKDDLAGLEDAGFLERVKLSFPCGKDVAGWRLTGAGRRALPGRDPAEGLELEPEHLRILNDVYHSSRLSAHRGMMPKALAKQFDGDDLDDLFTHGYLLRIRIKSAGKAKGWIVSSKGMAALRRAAAKPEACVASPDGP